MAATTLRKITCKTKKAKSITATVLILSGIVVLAYSGISFTTPGETV